MSLVYLDACVIIYLVDGVEPFHSAVRMRLAAYALEPDARLMTSRLSMLECRTRPLKEDDQRLLAAYHAFFSAERFVLLEIDTNVIDTATELRAAHAFRTPDAIHLATAITHSADIFLTGDAALTKCRGVDVQLLA